MNTGTNKTQLASEAGALSFQADSEQSLASHENAYRELIRSITAALETYSNVHRGSGHFSKVTTHLYEKAREIVLEYLGFKKNAYTVIFGSTLRLFLFSKVLKPGSCKLLRSSEFGLSLGVNALAVKKNALPPGIPFESGGGNTRLYGADWVMWAGYPEKFEAGTPAIINIIAFAKALKIINKYGRDAFLNYEPRNLSVSEILDLNPIDPKNGKVLLDEMRNAISGNETRVPTTEGPAAFVNLDSSASTPAFRPATEAFLQMLQQPAAIKQEVVKEVRKICTTFLNVPESEFEIVFTSNTTESINIAARSEGLASDNGTEPVILTSILEHSSNDLPWRTVPRATVIRLATDKEGFFDLQELELLLRSYNVDHHHGKKRISMVALSGASNVLGTCNDLHAAGELVKKHGARLLVDAAQLAAHREIDMQAMNADFLVLSGHKMYAPFGTGVLVARKGMLHFEQEEMDRIKASGEENAGGIAALGSVMLILQRIGFRLIEEEERTLTAKVMNLMSSLPDVSIYGISDTDSPRFRQKTGVIAFDVKNRMAGRIAGNLAYQGGIGIRFGCHCAHLIVKHVLNFTPTQERIQRFVLRLLPFITLQGMSRVSFGLHNTEQDADRLIVVLRRIILKSQHDGVSVSRNEKKSGQKQTTKVVKQQMKEFIAEREQLVYL
jgi:selenocysteine lyase/cysteine desulfurase